MELLGLRAGEDDYDFQHTCIFSIHNSKRRLVSLVRRWPGMERYARTPPDFQRAQWIQKALPTWPLVNFTLEGLTSPMSGGNPSARLAGLGVNLENEMEDLIEPHEPVHDCDCRECACHERNRLRAALVAANDQAEHFERHWYLAREDADRYAYAKTPEGQVVTIETFKSHGAVALDQALDDAMAEDADARNEAGYGA